MRGNGAAGRSARICAGLGCRNAVWVAGAVLMGDDTETKIVSAPQGENIGELAISMVEYDFKKNMFASGFAKKGYRAMQPDVAGSESFIYDLRA